MTAKRGVELEAIHFYSYPYTSERAKQKVIDLTKILCDYCGRIKLYVVPFTEIQTHIKKYCPQDLTTIVMRRIMMEIACRLAEKTNSQAIITGESIGQVASQTIHALAATDIVATIPVFRPVIGMDKNEIIQISRKIETYETQYFRMRIAVPCLRQDTQRHAHR
jgi:thiamine biosynthesis protein ThiI